LYKHPIADMITPENPNAFFIMPMIMKQFSKDSAILDLRWSEKCFLNIEKTRMAAQNYGHSIEEAIILLYENRYLREKHEDREKFLANVRRLSEVQAIFDMDDEHFRHIYQNIYPASNKLSRKVIGWRIRSMFEMAGYLSRFFSGNLDFKSAQLCGKVMEKIEAISPESIKHDQIIETYFARAVDYGNIRDFSSAFHYYDMAIEKARSAQDRTYLFIAIQRKLSICIGLSQFDSQTDCDLERISCIREMSGMMTDGIENTEDLGNALVNEELQKKAKAPRKEKQYYQNRVDKVLEATPMLSLLLAMARKDEKTSRVYLDRLKDGERHAYGSFHGYSSADMLEKIYSMMFNSPEREEYEEDMEACACPDLEECEIMPEFKKNMTLAQQFTSTMFDVRNFITLRMYKSAGLYCGHLVLLADKAKSDYHMALALNAYGQTLEAQQNTIKALRLYKQALSLLECADPKVSDADLSPFLYYNLLCEIGRLLIDEEPEESAAYFTMAKHWLEKHHMSQMLFSFQILNGRADAYHNLGRQDLADKDRADFLKFAEEETKRRIMLLDADSRDIFWNDTRALIHGTIAQIKADSSDEYKKEAYNAVLLSKGMLLSSEKSVKDIALSNPTIKKLYEELEDNELRRKQWGVSDIVEEYTERYLKSMELVAELESVIPGNGGFLHTTFDDIIKVLGEGDVLVDYFDYESGDDDRQYIAFVLKSGASAPEVVELCRESDLTEYFETQMKTIPEGKEVDFDVIYEPFHEESRKLQEIIWEPAVKECNILPGNKIRFIPSGSLHKVAIESLPFDENWGQTLCDRYPIFARISHARVIQDAVSPGKESAVIFAAPDYGGDIPAESSTAKGYTVSMNEHIYGKASKWPSLPDTLTEAEELQTIFKMASWEVTSFTEKEASSTNFKRLNGQSPAILHISTHGFSETKKSVRNIPALSSYYKPLDLTGIVLANGNEGWLNGTKYNHEGVVLASEIASMDLSGSDIVFVSCCFSGEGTVKPDGIYGIQRALKKAGVRTIIMSLWSEHEFAGRIFANAFYSSILDGQDKNEAFRNAKQKVREKTRHPYYWAGFIMLD